MALWLVAKSHAFVDAFTTNAPLALHQLMTIEFGTMIIIVDGKESIADDIQSPRLCHAILS